MSQWQIVSAVALIGWLVLVVGGLRSYPLNANLVVKSIVIWSGIILAITVIVLNREAIAAFFAPARAMMP